MSVQGGNQQRGSGIDVQIGWMRRGPLRWVTHFEFRTSVLGARVHVRNTWRMWHLPMRRWAEGRRTRPSGLGEAARCHLTETNGTGRGQHPK